MASDNFELVLLMVQAVGNLGLELMHGSVAVDRTGLELGQAVRAVSKTV